MSKIPLSVHVDDFSNEILLRALISCHEIEITLTVEETESLCELLKEAIRRSRGFPPRTMSLR